MLFSALHTLLLTAERRVGKAVAAWRGRSNSNNPFYGRRRVEARHMYTGSHMYRDQPSTYGVTSKRRGMGAYHGAYTHIFHDQSSTYEVTTPHWGIGRKVSH